MSKNRKNIRNELLGDTPLSDAAFGLFSQVSQKEIRKTGLELAADLKLLELALPMLVAENNLFRRKLGLKELVPGNESP